MSDSTQKKGWPIVERLLEALTWFWYGLCALVILFVIVVDGWNAVYNQPWQEQLFMAVIIAGPPIMGYLTYVTVYWIVSGDWLLSRSDLEPSVYLLMLLAFAGLLHYASAKWIWPHADLLLRSQEWHPWLHMAYTACKYFIEGVVAFVLAMVVYILIFKRPKRRN